MQIKKAKVTKVYRWLENTQSRINVLRGGTGSSKSYSMAQYFILNKLVKGDRTVNVIARKTLPALKKTAYKLVMDLIKEYQIPYNLNKTDLELTIGSNTCYFMSVDDPDKIASLQTDNIWLEEAVDFTKDDWQQFNLRMSNQMYMTFNPVSAMHWIKSDLIDSGIHDLTENVSTYKDNPFLPKARIREIENLIKQDQNYYNIYALGLWGVLKNIIYNFPVVEVPGKETGGWDDIIYGLDFGYNNPSALVKVYIKDGMATGRELLYESGLTNTRLIEEVNKVVPVHNRSRDMYADSAEPARISEFYQAGYNIKPADKSVKDGIDTCKTRVIGITKDSPNLIKEARTYKYKEDKDGNVLEDPVPFNDHLLDSLRYATHTYLKQGKPEIYIMGGD